MTPTTRTYRFISTLIITSLLFVLAAPLSQVRCDMMSASKHTDGTHSAAVSDDSGSHCAGMHRTETADALVRTSCCCDLDYTHIDFNIRITLEKETGSRKLATSSPVVDTRIETVPGLQTSFSISPSGPDLAEPGTPEGRYLLFSALLI